MKTFSLPPGRRTLAAAAAILISTSGAWAQETKPIKIGVLTDMSSLYSDITGKGSVMAATMATEDFAASTGKHRPTLLVTGDHLNKPDIATSIAREWIDRDGVDVIVDVPNSAVALAVNNIVRSQNKVMIASGASSSDLTGKACSPNFVHWTYDTYALATGTAAAVVESGGKSWYMLTADYAFGHTMEQDIRSVVTRMGGQVLGSVKTPINTQDFSSFLLQAQSSKSQIIGLVNAGGDTINSIKQGVEFGITNGNQKLVPMVMYINDVHSLGLPIAQGLQFTEAFYWDLNDQTRTWSKRFAARNGGKYPSALQAGVYAGVLHYLKAAESLGSSADGKAVVERMKATPTDDPLFGKGSIRADGRKLHDMYLFQVKKPSESKYPWDYYHVKKTIPASAAWRPLSQGGCPFIKS